MFDNLPALAPSTLELRDELEVYLLSDPEQVGGNTSKEVITWWYERWGVYPRLHRMALDYLTIPGMFNI